VADAVRAGTRVATDGWGAYKGLAERGYQLEMHVQHGKRDVMDQHLPKVGLFFSNLEGLAQRDVSRGIEQVPRPLRRRIRLSIQPPLSSQPL